MTSPRSDSLPTLTRAISPCRIDPSKRTWRRFPKASTTLPVAWFFLSIFTQIFNDCGAFLFIQPRPRFDDQQAGSISEKVIDRKRFVFFHLFNLSKAIFEELQVELFGIGEVFEKTGF